LPIAEERIRSAFRAHLDRASKRFAADTPDDDVGFEIRAAAAGRAAREVPRMDLDDFLEAAAGGGPKDQTPRQRRWSRVITRIFANPDDVIVEDLIPALLEAAGAPIDLIKEALAAHERATLAGEPSWEIVLRPMTLRQKYQRLDGTPVEELQHVTSLIFQTRALVNSIAFLGGLLMAPIESPLPEEMNTRYRSAVVAMRQDPMWQIWGRIGTMSPRLRDEGFIVALLALSSLEAGPAFADQLSGFRDRLQGLLRPTVGPSDPADHA